MKHLLTSGVLGFALLVTGCQQTSTTAPGTTKTTTTRTDTTRAGGEHESKAEKTEATVVKKLTLTTKKDHTIKRGDTDKVTVMINRTHFEDPVTIEFGKLPKGVELVDKHIEITSGSNSVTVTLKAGADAELGEHDVTVTAKAPGIPENTQTLRLTVKEK